MPKNRDKHAVSYYQKSLWPKMFDKQIVTAKELRALKAMSQNNIGCPTWSHDYSICLVSKRLYHEASPTLYEKVTLIVPFLSIPMYEPLHQDNWPHSGARLSFVRHLTLDSRTAFELLWHGSHGIGLTTAQRGSVGHFSYVALCLKLRESFPNVERIHACSSTTLGPSLNNFKMLMSPQARHCAIERFPRLYEIRYTHEIGGEMRLRLKNSTWELGYNKGWPGTDSHFVPGVDLFALHRLIDSLLVG